MGNMTIPQLLSNRVCNGCSRPSKVVDFGANQKRICLLVINSNFDPILPRYTDIAGFTHPILPEFLRCSP